MSITQKALSTLEFDRIRAMLAETARTEGARERAMMLTPSVGAETIRKSLGQTSDAKRLAGLRGTPSFGDVRDVTDALDRAAKGAALSARELLEIARVLQVARSLRDYNETDKRFDTSLDELFSLLIVNRHLEERITHAILSEDMIADEASPELAEIRRKTRAANARVRETLQKYITGTTYSKYLQENIVTMRNGRYVIPVKAEHKNEIHGLVHDTSASGATIFIEPMGVVEANNEIRTLAAREQKEIERILFELSAEAAGYSGAITADYHTITELAFIFAKAELSYQMNADEPHLTETGELQLIEARHPLLDRSRAVPITVKLGGEFDTLVITGPNTGGKTVTLKTVGLLTLMTQAGLHIPASSQSWIRVYESVYADIGDEQSIEQSLSTFSAHMVNIVSIIEKADDGSLVLIDELGAGTDPVEGAALAVSILEYLRANGAQCLATTHYAELKSFALSTPGVMNASCEFDVETLRPTYRLVIGTPGRSNAFAISEKLGLPQNVVSRAQELVNTENKQFETVLEKLEQNRVEMEKNREETDRMRAEYETFRRQSEEKIVSLEKEAEKELEKARAKAVQILESARVSSDFVLAQLDEARAKKDRENFKAELAATRERIRNSLDEAGNEADPVRKKSAEDYVLPRPLHDGDKVFVISIQREAVVMGEPDKNGNVTVLTGSARTRTKISNLMLDEDRDTVKKKEQKPKPRTTGDRVSVAREARMELDIRGETGDDGWFRADKYLDEAILSGRHSVVLIHGKGTGALRKAIWNQLRHDPRVKSYRAGELGEGDTGVTVVELK